MVGIGQISYDLIAVPLGLVFVLPTSMTLSGFPVSSGCFSWRISDLFALYQADTLRLAPGSYLPSEALLTCRKNCRKNRLSFFG